MTVDPKILDRLKKLLNLAERGGTEEEAASAAEMAANIALKYGIDLATVQGSSPAGPGIKQGYIVTEPKYQVWINNLVMACCALNACQGYWVTSPGNKSVAWVATGSEASVMTVIHTVNYLIAATKRLNRSYVKSRALDKSGRKDFRDSFRLAASQRLAWRMTKRLEELRTQDGKAQEATGQNALVVANYFDQQMSEIEKFFQERGLNIVYKPAASKRVASPDGYRAGLEAGESISLDTQVEGPADRQSLR